MRFEGEAAEYEDELIRGTGNRWYFFIPLPLVGLGLVVAAAQVVASMLVRTGGHGSAEPSDLLHDALEVMDWLGGLGWVLLLPFYFVVLANKRASPWWVLGGFCCGLNLLLYIVLLFMPARRRSIAAFDLPTLQPIGMENLPRPSGLRLKDSFVCESCDALINYGVSQCSECGQRYRYVDGEPLADDTSYRR